MGGIFSFFVLLVMSGVAWCGNIGLKMGVEGEELSQKIHTPPAAQGIQFGTWFAPGLPSDPQLIPISNAPRQPGVLVPVSQLVPSVQEIATRTEPTSTIPGSPAPGRRSLDEIFLQASNANNPGSNPATPPASSPSQPSSPTTSIPVDPGTGLIAPYDSLSFNDAFAKAMKDLGRGKAFAWRGKKYGTCYSGDPKLAECEALVAKDAKKQTGN